MTGNLCVRIHYFNRLVPIHESGWRSFDVTQAIHYWSKAQKKTPLHLEVWTEGERPGSYAAEMAKRVRFATQDPKENTLEKDMGAPELVFYTLNLDEYGWVLLLNCWLLSLRDLHWILHLSVIYT